MSELFDTSAFSSKNQIGGRADSAWDDGSAFPIFLEETWTVGDRIAASGDDKANASLGTVTGVNKKIITITWQNGLSAEYTTKQIQSYGYQKFLEDEGAIASCNSNTPASSQELEASTSLLLPPEQMTESLQNSSLKTTPTLKQSSNTDSQKSPYTPTSATITLNRDNSTFTQLDFLVLEPVAQETVQDSATQNHHSGLNPSDVSPMEGQVSSSLKILKDLSIKDYEQFLGDSEWLATLGTIRNSYRRRKLERHNNVTDSLLLPTPTTYAKGSTGCRPAGQTRLEQKLKPYLTKGDKLNPAVPGWMMGFPVGWVEKVLMDGGETISVQLPFTQEYVTTSTSDGNATTCTPVQSAPSRLRSQLSESVILPTLLTQLKQSDVKLDLYICNSFSKIGKIIEVWETCFTVDWSSEIKCYFWERDNQIIGGLAIAPQHLIDKFFSLDVEPLPLREGETLKAIEDKSKCQVIPENFLEETKGDTKRSPSPKRRQRKGCLYKYLENKKLKDGRIASYPRVIGNRQPNNPTHWRWGFNWEEKVDGEWKGRSFGCVPVGAIALIQSMQNEGVPLEEIIGFIKRAKAKK